jgi:subtilase family serine protease
VKLETRITFTATVKNQGSLASSNTTLEIKDLTHNRTLERLAVPGLAVDESVDIVFTWYVENVPVGALILRFMVDPDDMINEQNEFNNDFVVNVVVEAAALPDLTYTEEDAVLFFPAEPRVGEAVTISITVVNIGTNASEGTILEVRLGNNVIATANLLPLGVGEHRIIDVQWGATEIQSPLEYTILVRIDPDNGIRESDKTNNEVVTTVTFVQPPSAVLDNLVVTADPTKIEDGEKVIVTVSIDNTGDDPAIITITIKDGLTEVGSKSGITVPAGGSKSETFSIKLEGTGDHEITATVYDGSEVAQDPAGNDLSR